MIHIIELPKFNKTLDELVSDLDRWTYFLKHGSQLDLDNLPSQLQSDGFTKAVKGLVMLSLDQQKRDDYTRRRLWEMDQKAYAKDREDYARDREALNEKIRQFELEAELRGRTAGQTEGQTEGRTAGLAEGALTMLVRGGTRRLGVLRLDSLPL